MVALKARDIDRFIAKPDFSNPVFFLFGPDQGLVAERADMIAKASGVDLADPFSLIRLSADEATSDPLKIADEANTIGMFGGKRMIRVSGSTRGDLFKALKPVLDTPPEEAWVIVEAGDLDRRSALRNKLEKHKACICLPCYQDNAAALEKLIDEEIVSQGLQLDREARQELRSLLGDNRMLSRNELKKLAIFAQDKQRVEIDDIRAVVGDGSAMVLVEIADAASIGNTSQLQMLLPRAIEDGNRPDMILQNCLKHFQLLQRLRSRMESDRQSAANLIGSVKPPIHFSRQDAVKQALNIWRVNNISRSLSRLNRMMFEARKNASAAASIAGTTLLAIALEAEVLRRR